jgi:uncharacterized membrane protein
MDLIHESMSEHIVIHHVSPGRIMHWLRLGLNDMRRTLGDAMFYGALFVLMGYLLQRYLMDNPSLTMTMSTIFVLLGPFLAIGIYDLARQLEKQAGAARVRVSLRRSMLCWRENLQGFTLYAVLLAVLVFSWFRVSLLMFALFYDYASLPALDQLFSQAWMPDNRGFLLAYFGTGFFFAALAFAISAISVPMMLDREVDTVTAMLSSVQAVYQNLLTMTLWAGMIALLTAVGLASWFLGLLITMPLIGLATWHAYRDLITYER